MKNVTEGMLKRNKLLSKLKDLYFHYVKRRVAYKGILPKSYYEDMAATATGVTEEEMQRVAKECRDSGGSCPIFDLDKAKTQKFDVKN